MSDACALLLPAWLPGREECAHYVKLDKLRSRRFRPVNNGERRRLHIAHEKTFSWHNVCLISSQCPTATRVAGFQTWRTMGRFVRKGEKGIAILAPIIGRREAESESDNARTVRGFRAAYVFDVDQTDGEPLPTPIEASGDPGARTALLKTAILEQGIALEYVDELGGALGTSSGGCIRLLNGLSPAMEFTTLVHEHAHELLHRADDRPASRDTRELEAEAVAFVVGGAVGLNTSDASRDYVAVPVMW